MPSCLESVGRSCVLCDPKKDEECLDLYLQYKKVCSNSEKTIKDAEKVLHNKPLDFKQVDSIVRKLLMILFDTRDCIFLRLNHTNKCFSPSCRDVGHETAVKYALKEFGKQVRQLRLFSDTIQTEIKKENIPKKEVDKFINLELLIKYLLQKEENKIRKTY
jgi:hypothetical protein